VQLQDAGTAIGDAVDGVAAGRGERAQRRGRDIEPVDRLVGALPRLGGAPVGDDARTRFAR